jgi:phage gp37-like protein
MKVKELIEFLKEYNEDMLVVVDGYEGDCDDPFLRAV